MTRLPFPSASGRRAVRRALLRRRRSIMAVLVAVAVASGLSAVVPTATTAEADGRPAASGRAPSASASATAWLPGLVSAPVRLADAGVSGLLSRGDVVDVLCAPAEVTSHEASLADVVAESVRVLDVQPYRDSASADAGALVVLAVTPVTARALAYAASWARLSVVIRIGATGG